MNAFFLICTLIFTAAVGYVVFQIKKLLESEEDRLNEDVIRIMRKLYILHNDLLSINQKLSSIDQQVKLTKKERNKKVSNEKEIKNK